MTDILNKPMFGAMFWKHGFWIRIFRKGLWVAYNDKLPPLFSERYGYVKVYKFWRIKFKWLD